MPCSASSPLHDSVLGRCPHSRAATSSLLCGETGPATVSFLARPDDCSERRPCPNALRGPRGSRSRRTLSGRLGAQDWASPDGHVFDVRRSPSCENAICVVGSESTLFGLA
jgi:hypothetical protein